MGCIWATVRAREGGPIAFPAGGLSIGVPYAAPEPLGMLRWPRTAESGGGASGAAGSVFERLCPAAIYT